MNNSRVIALSVKSLEQTTKSVSLPRDATVLELKAKVQVVFDIDGNRQRLIFQGKVLKDDKTLLDYENLDDGKVIHLVIRPIDAPPSNPENDEPRRASSIPWPPTRNISEYAVITLDATLADLSSGNPFMSLLNNLTPAPLTTEASPFSPRTTPRTDGVLQALRSSTRDAIRSRVLGASRLLDAMDMTRPRSESSSTLSLPVPSSVEMRLARALFYIREIQNILDTPVTSDTPRVRRNHSILGTLRQYRESIRDHATTPEQVSYVLDELATLMTNMAPFSRIVATQLINSEHDQLAHVLRTAQIAQRLSIIHHFLGSVLSSVQTGNSESSSTESWSLKRKTPDNDDNAGDSSATKSARTA